MQEFDYEKDAQECLDLLVKQCEYVEYDQMNITLPYEKEVYKWINLGRAVSDAVDNTFPNNWYKRDRANLLFQILLWLCFEQLAYREYSLVYFLSCIPRRTIYLTQNK